MAPSHSRLFRFANANPNYDRGGVIGNSKIQATAHTSFSGWHGENTKCHRLASVMPVRDNQDVTPAVDFLEGSFAAQTN
jgi:hypothetical protein